METLPRDTAERIIQAATLAPSGSNSQPWRFVVHADALEFRYLPERDHPFLNFEEGGTLIALGAAIENAELEARALGLEPHTTYVPTGPSVATMRFTAAAHQDHAHEELAAAIPNRHSNRKAYQREPLPQAFRTHVADPAFAAPLSARLTFIESREDMEHVARALTTMEELALSTEKFHELFFKEILWSQSDNEAGMQGLYLKTLELPPPAQVIFRLLSHWPLARAAARIGMPKSIARTNAQQDAAAAAFGVLYAERATTRGVYLDTGRLLERTWLYATAHGLSLQVVTGITFLARAMVQPAVVAHFSALAQARAADSLATIRAIAGVEPVLIFRIGNGAPPTDVSHRHAPDISYA